MEVSTKDIPEKEVTITFGGKEIPVSQVGKSVGYEQSAVWCKNVDELIGVITHGKMDLISPADALKVVSYLVTEGKAEEIITPDGTVTWNIHHNENAVNMRSKAT